MEHTMDGKKLNVQQMVRISMLGLMGFILLLFNFPLPIFPSFLKLDISSLPGIVAAISMGPFAAVAVEFVKNLLKIVLDSHTLGIGEVSNFLSSVALVLPIAMVYKKMPSLKGYIIGGIAGIIVLSVTASLFNYFLIIPAYAIAFGGMDAIIGLASKVNDNITNLKSLILLGVIPFNIVKGGLVVVLGRFMYKFLNPLLKVSAE